MRPRSPFLLLVLLIVAGCQGGADTPKRALLTGRAILPADTFTEGPAVGRELEPVINGRSLPFAQVPVQGFSSLIVLPDSSLLVLQDNGFGSRANSPDVPLRWYHVTADLTLGKPHGGPVTILSHTDLTDPQSLVPFGLTDTDSRRTLHGGDFDPESFVRLDDGTFWVGEEFGPYLLHFDGQGTLLDPPVAIPVPGPLRHFGHGSYLLRSPDHPQLRDNQEVDRLANLPGSGGIEGLARNRDGSLLYLSVEKPLLGDPDRTRRSLLEFDPVNKHFTGNFWFYRTDLPDQYLTSLEWVTDRVFLVLERDGAEGTAAVFKRIFRVNLDQADKNFFVNKTLVCDLLDIRDSFGFSQATEGAVGLGAAFSFPYVTTEAVAVLDAQTLLLCNDNNYPFSNGRRTDQPDATEFIRLKLPEPLIR